MRGFPDAEHLGVFSCVQNDNIIFELRQYPLSDARLWMDGRPVIIKCHVSLIFQNELAILEFIHCVVETMDRYFGNVVSGLNRVIQSLAVST